MIDHSQKPSHSKLHPLSAFIFMSRWLQLPLYLGAIGMLSRRRAGKIVGNASVQGA